MALAWFVQGRLTGALLYKVWHVGRVGRGVLSSENWWQNDFVCCQYNLQIIGCLCRFSLCGASAEVAICHAFWLKSLSMISEEIEKENAVYAQF